MTSEPDRRTSRAAGQITGILCAVPLTILVGWWALALALTVFATWIIEIAVIGLREGRTVEK